MKIAFTSSDGKNVDLHLGKAYSIYIYDSEDLKFLEKRLVDINLNAKHQGSKVIEALSDCEVIIAQEFGFKSKVLADSKNIILFKGEGIIEEVLKEFLNWYEIMKN